MLNHKLVTRLLCAGLSILATGALGKETQLTCTYVKPTNPTKTETWILTVDDIAKTVTHGRGKTLTSDFSKAMIKFKVQDANGWEFKYEFDRTKLTLNEWHHTGGYGPFKYDCVPVDPKV